MEPSKHVDAAPPEVGQAKARHELSWLVNEAFVTLDLTGTCCSGFDNDGSEMANRILVLCRIHPPLALEYFEVGDTGEKATLLETFLRNRIDPNFIQDFCADFPEALQVKSFSSQVYPLHVACEEFPHGDGQILIPFLASKFTEAVSACDSDGNLPLHKVLRRLAKAPRLAAASQEAVEVGALVKLFPESTIARGMDLAGQDPLHYVLSHQFSAAVMKSILNHIPETVTHFTLSDVYFAGGMASITREYAEAFRTFLPQLEHLVFLPSRTGARPVFTAEGWVSFLGLLACCPMLEHLEMELPYGLLKEDDLSNSTFSETLPSLTGLKSLVLSFPKVTTTTFNRNYSDHTQMLLSKPIAKLIKATVGNLRSLIVKEGVAMDPEPILRAIMDNSDSPLSSLDIRSCSGVNHDLTQPLAALIASNTKLESLFVKNSILQPQPIFEALAQNTQLKYLALPNLICETRGAHDDTTTSTLSNVLRHHNVSLERIQCLQTSFQQATGEEYQRIQHWAMLNRYGRGRAREVTFTCDDLIDLLFAVQRNPTLKNREKEKASVCYDLLREVPTRWAGGRHFLG